MINDHPRGPLHVPLNSLSKSLLISLEEESVKRSLNCKRSISNSES